MNLELIHTSAPRGLKPGSRGFTTVAMTRGLPAPLLDRLEQLSGYRFEFDPAGSEAHRNPINYAHMRITVGGKRCSVLSRVAPSGADYSGRTNKIAHHVIAMDNDTPDGGPAWALGHQGLFATEWSGEPTLRDAPPVLPTGDTPPVVCSEWEQLTGDAGWAGEALRVLMEDPQRRVFVVVPIGVDCLTLVSQALSLLAPKDRWEITFTTAYMGGLPSDVECRLRFVYATATGRRLAADAVGATVFDVATLSGPAPDSEYAAAARSGHALPRRAQRPPEEADAAPVRAAPHSIVRPSSQETAPSPAAAWGEREPLLPESTGDERPLASVQESPDPAAFRAPRKPLLAISLSAIAILLIVAASFATGVKWGRRASGDRTRETQPSANPTPTMKVAADPARDETGSSAQPLASGFSVTSEAVTRPPVSPGDQSPPPAEQVRSAADAATESETRDAMAKEIEELKRKIEEQDRRITESEQKRTESESKIPAGAASPVSTDPPAHPQAPAPRNSAGSAAPNPERLSLILRADSDPPSMWSSELAAENETRLSKFKPGDNTWTRPKEAQFENRKKAKPRSTEARPVWIKQLWDEPRTDSLQGPLVALELDLKNLKVSLRPIPVAKTTLVQLDGIQLNEAAVTAAWKDLESLQKATSTNSSVPRKQIDDKLRSVTSIFKLLIAECDERARLRQAVDEVVKLFPNGGPLVIPNGFPGGCDLELFLEGRLQTPSPAGSATQQDRSQPDPNQFVPDPSQ